MITHSIKSFLENTAIADTKVSNVVCDDTLESAITSTSTYDNLYVDDSYTQTIQAGPSNTYT